MASEELQPRLSIGDVPCSAFAAGSRAQARSCHGTTAARDHGIERLLAALREPRAHLPRTRAAEQSAEPDEAPAGAEDEITSTASADGTGLRRLRALLTAAASPTTVLTSAGTSPACWECGKGAR
ncbi:hypothetical protein [Streptomyces sp. Ac-502]|uniref:hypothetical protein n=1 Tax=Streptomyces sp. Ac-502 TaxID=3342801 RepID=UPI0038623A6B